jgi:hypothetical protein
MIPLIDDDRILGVLTGYTAGIEGLQLYVGETGKNLNLGQYICHDAIYLLVPH